MDSRRPELGADANPRPRAASHEPRADIPATSPRIRLPERHRRSRRGEQPAANRSRRQNPDDPQGSNAVDRPDCPAESHAVRGPHSYPNTANRRRRQTGTDATPSLEAGSTTLERIPREQLQAYACSTGSQRRLIDQAARQLNTNARDDNATGRDSEGREADAACSRAVLPMRTERMRRTRTAPARRRHAAGTPQARRRQRARTGHAAGMRRLGNLTARCMRHAVVPYAL